MTCKDIVRKLTYVSDCTEDQVEHSCDMILRREADVLTPVIFFNRDLPDVLACISREIQSLSMEKRLKKKIYGLSKASVSGPLDSWYKSILADIYKDKSSMDAFCMNTNTPYSSDCPAPVSFCLKGEIFEPMPQSSYLFVTLTLPPLWQRSREPYFHSALSVCSPKNCSSGKATFKKTDFRLFKFRYYPDNGLWYATQSGSAKKLRLLTDR